MLDRTTLSFGSMEVRSVCPDSCLSNRTLSHTLHRTWLLFPWGRLQRSMDLWLVHCSLPAWLTSRPWQNGPWLLNEDYEARENPYSWTNLGNVVYIEQPVGTGFSTGTPTAKDQTDSAGQFVNFLKTFYTTFPDLQNKKLWVTGESYAGMVSEIVGAQARFFTPR